MTKAEQRRQDQRIQRIYGITCSGVHLDIMDIGKVFNVGYEAIAAGADDNKLAEAIKAFVQTIRKN